MAWIKSKNQLCYRKGENLYINIGFFADRPKWNCLSLKGMSLIKSVETNTENRYLIIIEYENDDTVDKVTIERAGLGFTLEECNQIIKAV
jgi:hypothetical protein